MIKESLLILQFYNHYSIFLPQVLILLGLQHPSKQESLNSNFIHMYLTLFLKIVDKTLKNFFFKVYDNDTGAHENYED